MKLNNKKMNKFKKGVSIFIGIILLIAIYINTFLIVKYNVLPLKYLILYIVCIVLIPIFMIFFTIFRRPKKFIRFIMYFFEIFYIILLFIVFCYLNKTFNFVDKLTNAFNYETKNYYVLVSSNSTYNKIDDLNNKNIGYVNNVDVSLDKAIKELDNKVKLNHQEKSSYNEAFTSLSNEEIDGIIMIDSIYSLLTEDNEELKSNIKVLYEFSIKEKINSISKDVDVTEEPFNVYISGIDSYGKVTDKGRSDVNIVMSINPKTHKILMTNIPRDYFVKLYGINKMDKLTHAGIYGVETSAKTIEDILDIDINYYVKVNYNALIKLVDALDGVDVYSEYDFHSSEFNYKFVKGYNHVNGKMALDFCRTRYAFTNGDRVRGENQQRMIQAIITKANSPKILVKYSDFLEALEGTFTTNISTEKIMSLINMQLDKMPDWEISAISLNGKDGSEITYSFPSMELYVMYPDDETVESAKGQIQELMGV